MQVQGKLNLTLITGDPGGGKTTTGVGTLVDEFRKNPKVHLFANLHLFGVKFMFLPMEKLVEHFNDTLNGLPISDPKSIPLIGYGIYLYDEGYQGANAQEHSSSDTKVTQSLVLQSRKRHLKVIYVAQDTRLFIWELRKFATETLNCVRYNEHSPIIEVTKKKDGQPKKTFTYDGSQYWQYFRSDELHPMAQSRLSKALQRSMVNA